MKRVNNFATKENGYVKNFDRFIDNQKKEVIHKEKINKIIEAS